MKKNRLIHLRLSEDEHKEMEKAADDQNTSVSEYLRNLHRNKFKIFDIEGLIETLYILYPKDEAKKLEKKIRSSKEE